jgi:ATP-dependent DNA helicase RecQ
MTGSATALDLTAALGKFGLSSFRRGQKEVIEHIIAGQDCLCVMPTGGGKSLCYQLPSLVRPGLTIVVSPLIALMKDQVDSLQKRGIRATLINSSLTPQEQNERLEQVAAGRFSLVYVAPERLRNQRFLDSIRATPVQLFAIDEAHCISEWGHDFRPDYQRLGRFREALGNVQTIALTATATPRVRADILRSLQLTSAETFITGFARDNLYFGSVHCMSDREKDKQLNEFLDGRDESGIIYVATRKRCEALVDQLATDLKLSVGAYHAGLLPEQRKLIQDKFMAGELKAIVATNAFGMGIDKSDLRYVVHYNMPGTLEAYYQEAGRAGRDGLLSQCVLLFSPQDRYIQEFFIENANPSREIMHSVYDFLRACDEDPIELTADEIREQIGQSATAEAINSSLQILSRTGVVERLEVAGGLAMFRLSSRMPSFVDLLPRDASVRRTVLRSVEKAIGDRRDEPVYIHPRWMMEQLSMDRETMTRHLRELCKLEDFEYVPPFRGRAIHFRRKDVHFDQLNIDHAALAARKKADYEKLDQMVAYARSQVCRQRTILEYFGDTSASDCKICDRCQGKAGWPKMPPAIQRAQLLKPSDLAAASDLSVSAKNQQPTPEDIALPLNKALPKAADSRSKQKNAPESKSNIDEGPSRTSPVASKKPSVIDWDALPLATQRQAIALLQTLLGALERTHGYLSKTVITQHFSGTESKAITGLRLQRLPEFGLLKDWKKSHASNLIDLMLDHGLILLSELRMGKLTLSVSQLGIQCKTESDAIPIPVVAFIAQAQSPSVLPRKDLPPPNSTTAVEPVASKIAPKSTAKSNAQAASKHGSLHQAADHGSEAASPQTASPQAALPPVYPTELAQEREPAEKNAIVEKRAPAAEDENVLVRPWDGLPAAAEGDAAKSSVNQPIIADWQWTLRMVRHGYKLGECALIRGKTPDAVLADLTVAMQSGEHVSIEHLFDRRTLIAIKELRADPVRALEPPAVLLVFASLWPFVRLWLNRNSQNAACE